MVGVVVSSFTLSALLVRPFAGPAFDSFSRKRLLLIAQGIICLSFFCLRVRRLAGRAYRHQALPRYRHRVQRAFGDVSCVRVSAGREVCQRH